MSLNPPVPRKGFLLVLEGMDGSGKSSQAKAVHDRLPAGSIRSFEPTKGFWGQQIRTAAEEGRRFDPHEELEILLNDRAEHVREVVQPALDQGEIVILDRYYLSSLVYQSQRGQHSMEALLALQASFPTPDLIVYLRVTPEVSRERIEKRGEKSTAFEEHLQQVFDLYEQAIAVAAPQVPITVIDASLPFEEVTEKILEAAGMVVVAPAV